MASYFVHVCLAVIGFCRIRIFKCSEQQVRAIVYIN